MNMDLRSGNLYWPSVDEQPPVFSPLASDVECDVAIIGGGVSGALAADRISREGRRVVLVDRRNVCTASTPASTGLLQYEIDTPLTELTELVGRDQAQRAYLASHASLMQFRELVRGLDNYCGLIDRQSLYLSCEEDDYDELDAECTARRELKLEVTLLTPAELKKRFDIDRPGGALWSASAMEVDPYRLTLALLRRAVRSGTAIYAKTEIATYDPTPTGVTLGTNDGHHIRADHVIFATGYETPQFLEQNLCELNSTYAMASQRLTEAELSVWRDKCLIWESGDPYFYARTTVDNRVMIGGEDDEFTDPDKRDARLAAKCKTLVDKFKLLYPSIDIEPQFRWAGTFATTKDGLPLIGPHRQFPHGYFALGYGGNGITFSLIAATIIADQIAGRPNADAELFQFDR